MNPALVSAAFCQWLVLPILLFVSAGCVSNTVMEFRGTAVNADGTGQTEAGRRELGQQSSGTTVDGHRFFALGNIDDAEFWLTYPADEPLEKARHAHVRTYLIRDPGLQTLAGRTTSPDPAHWSNAVPLIGSVKIRFRDNTHFKIGVDVATRGTDRAALKGEFIGRHKIEFEPMAYVGAGAMLLGFGEGKPSPPRPPKTGNMTLLRQELLHLAKNRHSGASVYACIDAASLCVEFSCSDFIDPPGIEVSFAAEQQRRAVIKPKLQAACQELHLKMKDSPSYNLASPTVETEPHFLSLEIHGEPAVVAEKCVAILKQVFDLDDSAKVKIWSD